jgi:hypothetical protein
LIDAYRRLLKCGKDEITINKKNMAFQFGAVLLLTAAQAWFSGFYILGKHHHQEKGTSYITILSNFILIWSVAPVIYIVYCIQKTSD